MSCTLILKRSFPEMESCLLRDLESACAEDPFSRKWVLTSSGTLARHIRNRLEERIAGRSDISLGGLRIVSLSHFAAEIHKKIKKSNSAYNHPINDILLETLISSIPDYSPLAKLKSIDSGYSLLRPTFSDLADAGFGPGHIEIVTDAVREKGVSEREQSILELYFSWVGAVEAQDTGWRPLSEQALDGWIEQASPEDVSSSLSSEGGKPCCLFIDGFYDFTDNNLQLIANLSKSQNIRLYFPDNRVGREAHPAFDFSEIVLQDIKTRMQVYGDSELQDPEESQGQSQETLVADYLDRTFPAGQVDEQPDFITFQKASSLRAESISAALQVRRWVDDQGIDPEEIMVVFTSAVGYLGPVREAFDSFCLPVNILDWPVELSEKKRKLSVLKSLWKEDAQAEWVFLFLRENQDFCRVYGIEPDHFESELRKVSFGGGSKWKEIRNLSGSRAGYRSKIPDLTPEEHELIELIIATWVEKPRFPIAPDLAGKILSRISAWANEENFFKAAIESLKLWAELRPESGITESLFSALVFNSSVTDKTGSDLSKPGVKLIPMMRARGLTCRAIVLMGLSSGVFPLKAEEDYFLGDATRAEVARRAGALGHRLPVKFWLTDEMVLLFYLLNTSAERVHWVVPETDGAGRLVTPTSWIQHFVQQWERNQPEFLGRIAPSPAEQACFLKGLDPVKGSWLPPGTAFLLGSRQSERLYDYHGIPRKWKRSLVPDRESPEFFGQVSSASFGGQAGRLGVTGIQKLAKCPYMFYAEMLLGVSPIEIQIFPDSVTPMEKGSLLHSCLEKLFQDSKGVASAAREFSLRPESISSVVKAAVKGSPALGLLPVTLRSVFEEQLARVILDYLCFAAENTPHGMRFESFEKRLERPFPGLPAVTLKGIADRIDRDTDTGIIQITDYKSGGNRELTGKNKHIPLDLGWIAQASLYKWMLESQPVEDEICFSYVFLGEPEKKEVPAVPSVDGEQLLESLSQILARGTYLPVSNGLMREFGLPSLEPCRFCCYMSMCGRIDPEQMKKAAELFRKICPERAAAIEKVSDGLGQT